ncbi:autotransporter domain-containing protein [Lysobacter sp. K5869]|uniref:autotransporter outer membrane beta-barrel domain-containing protein n=1 Tax=Lysobacter sp. K5869 TaxID=2820808 RepID=UPI001C05FDD5|nr:autotransporter outer membrane beta-barrel domain-containing protein [Lysobacter sp. K5869]QWP77295.1 autotransporter domain-containing protein [Lysobacter sp. K5869]
MTHSLPIEPTSSGQRGRRRGARGWVRGALAAAVALGLQLPGAALAADPVNYWDNGSGVWNAGNTNWTREDGSVGAWTPGVAAFRVAGANNDISVEGAQVFTGLGFSGANNLYRLSAGAGGALSIGAAQATIAADSLVRATIDVPIVGAGGLDIVGPGRVYLSNTNTYAGDTTLRGGELDVAFDASLGGGKLRFAGGQLNVLGNGFDMGRDIQVDAAATNRIQLLGSDAAALRLKGNVSGTGRLNIFGRGSVTFEQRNDGFSGGLVVNNNATIVARTTGAFGTGPLAAYDNAEIRFESQASAADLGITVLDGAARTISTVRFVDRSDAGRATIAIENLYGQVLFEDESSAGSARIGSGGFGTVAFGESSNAGNAVIALARGTSTTVSFFDQADARQATIVSAGTVAFRDHAVAGGLAIGNVFAVDTSGMSQPLSIGSLAAGGLLRLGASTLTLGGLGRDDAISSMEGTGTLVKTGAGTLALERASGLFTGQVQVEQGRVRLDDFSAGVFSVGANGTLFGKGRMRGLTNAGTLAPGDGLGVLTVDGDYLQRAGARLQVDVAADGRADLLKVGGRAVLEGGTLDVIKAPGQYAYGTRYTLIDAQGGVSGRFDQLTQNQPFLKLAMTYDAQHAYLDVLRSDTRFQDVCDGFNRCGVATALDAIAAGGRPSADMEAVIEELTTLSEAGAMSGIDRLSGDAHAGFAAALLQRHSSFGQDLSRRALQRDGAGDAGRGGAWIRVSDGSTRMDGDRNAPGVDLDARGTALGADGWIAESVLLGASAQFDKLDADLRAGDQAKAEVAQLTVYAGWRGANAYLNGALGYASWRNRVERSVVAGDIARRAQSRYDGQSYSAYLEGGWTFELGGSRLQPLLSIARTRLDNDGFREGGAQDVDLVGASAKLARTTASAGLRWSADYDLGDWALSPRLEARALRGYGDEYAQTNLEFAGAPGYGFGVRSAALPKQGGLASAGIQLGRGERLSLFLDCAYQRGDGVRSRDLSAGLRYRW